MSEVSSPIVFPSDAYLKALSGAAAMLPSSLPREHDEAVCCEFVRAVEGLLEGTMKPPGWRGREKTPSVRCTRR